jgi:hypothetical protein
MEVKGLWYCYPYLLGRDEIPRRLSFVTALQARMDIPYCLY